MTPEDFKAWRKAVGLTSQRQAADALGVSVESVENWERGSRREGRPAPIDRRTALACAALAAGLDEWKPE